MEFLQSLHDRILLLLLQLSQAKSSASVCMLSEAADTEGAILEVRTLLQEPSPSYGLSCSPLLPRPPAPFNQVIIMFTFFWCFLTFLTPQAPSSEPDSLPSCSDVILFFVILLNESKCIYLYFIPLFPCPMHWKNQALVMHPLIRHYKTCISHPSFLVVLSPFLDLVGVWSNWIRCHRCSSDAAADAAWAPQFVRRTRCATSLYIITFSTISNIRSSTGTSCCSGFFFLSGSE